MIDCGESTQQYLKDNHIRMQRIGHIFISHLHGDHYFGLICLLSSMHLFGRRTPLHLYAPPVLESIIKIQLEVGGTELMFPLVFHPTQAQTPELLYEDSSLTVQSFPLDHGMPTTGFIFKEKEKGKTSPKSFAYCSDTAYCEAIIPYIRHVDLLYHETTFLDSEIELAKSRFHSTARQAALIARKAEVKKMLMGHYSARYLGTRNFVKEASSIFSEVVAAEEGLLLEI